MNSEQIKGIEKDPHKELQGMEESFLWALSLHRERKEDFEKAKEIGDKELVEKVSRTCEDYSRMVSALENEFTTLITNNPKVATQYGERLKERISLKFDEKASFESIKEEELDSIKNTSSDMDLVKDVHLYKLLHKKNKLLRIKWTSNN